MTFECVLVCVFVCECVYIYIYIYIFTSLLSTSIHGYQEKEKKNYQNLEITISRIPAWGKKKKIFSGKKKEMANFITPVLKKIKRYAVSWSKEQNPPMLQLQIVLNTK